MLKKTFFGKLEPFISRGISFKQGTIGDSEAFDYLCKGNYIIEERVNELERLQKCYLCAQAKDPFLVTIATTLDCNMACYYCYQERQPVYLSQEGCNEIYNYVTGKIEGMAFKRVYVDWYGGEPLLNKKAIEWLSKKLIDFCDKQEVKYSASIVSNGTLWLENSIEFVRKNRIRQVQFTLDGLPERHNIKRPFRKGIQKSSFQEIAKRIDVLLGYVKLYLRINVDTEVVKDIPALVKFFIRRGWLRKGAKFYPYLAPISPLTSRCAFLKRGGTLSTKLFDEATHQFIRTISRYLDEKELKHLQYYPLPIRLPCAAVGLNSVVFGPDGEMYKCGLEVGFPKKSHGHVRDMLGNRNPTSQILKKWMSYNPFSIHKCSNCSFLPICMGGCPKTHFEEDTSYYLEDTCQYWKDNFEKIIKTYIDVLGF